MIRRFWMNNFDFEREWRSMWKDAFRTTHYTIGELVDTSRYDVINGNITPRSDYKDRLLKQKEEEIKELDSYYQKRKAELKKEKDELTE